MRILVYGINFPPELTGVGKYTGEMAKWLAEQGHQVRVVTGPPYYPQWRVADGYNPWWYKTEVWAGVRVWRCPVWVPRRPGGFKRLLHLASFAFSSFPAVMRQVFWRPHVVWVVEPPLFCAPAGWLLARLCRARCWLHIQDYEVDAAFELGLLQGRAIRRVVAAGERWLMRRFDRVSTISERMMERAVVKGVSPDRLVFFPNWINLSSIKAPLGENPLRKELNIPPGMLVALYSGTMGAKQGLELLAEVARLLQNTPDLVFVFCGNGPGRVELEHLCAGLPNVRFLDLQPEERLGALLALADIHLLPQRASAADLVMPSKMTAMLASGTPVVATSHGGTELARVLASCGRVVPPGDARAMARAILELARDTELRRRLGEVARAYAEQNFDHEKILERFQRELKRLVSRSAQDAV